MGGPMVVAVGLNQVVRMCLLTPKLRVLSKWGKCSRDWMKGHCCKTCFNCSSGCGSGNTTTRGQDEDSCLPKNSICTPMGGESCCDGFKCRLFTSRGQSAWYCDLDP